jgi:hypothetical protein
MQCVYLQTCLKLGKTGGWALPRDSRQTFRPGRPEKKKEASGWMPLGEVTSGRRAAGCSIVNIVAAG